MSYKTNLFILFFLYSFFGGNSQSLKCNLLESKNINDTLYYLIELQNINKVPFCFISNMFVNYHIENRVFLNINTIDLKNDTSIIDLIYFFPGVVSASRSSNFRIIINPYTSIVFKVSIPLNNKSKILNLKYNGYFDKKLSYEDSRNPPKALKIGNLKKMDIYLNCQELK